MQSVDSNTLLSNRFQIIFMSIKEYANFSQHLFQLTRSIKNKLTLGNVSDYTTSLDTKLLLLDQDL